MAIELSDKTKEEIINCGALGFNYKDVAVNFNLPVNEVREQFEMEEGEVYILWKQGRLNAEAKLRQSVFVGAVNGSTPLLMKMLEYYKKTDSEHYNL